MPSTPPSRASAPRLLDLFGLDPHDQHPCPMGDPGVVQRLVDRLVGIAVLHVLADDRDPDLMLGVHDPVNHLAPLREVQRGGLQPQPLDQDVVEPVLDQAQRHLVDAELLVPLLDHGLPLDVAEEGDLVLVVGRDRDLGPADQDIRLDADLPQGAHRVLGRLGLELAAALR